MRGDIFLHMGYWNRKIRAGKTIEVYNSYTKNVGRKEALARRKVSPEEIEKVNERNAEEKLTRLINANFGKGDTHLVLTYFRQVRPEPEEAKMNLSKFLRGMRKECKKLEVELKYIHVTEYLTKSIHHHLIINTSDIPDALKLIRKCWKYGNPKITPMDGTGQYKKLAGYFIKETKKVYKGSKGQRQRYTPSRNLVRPEPKWKIMKRNRWPTNPKPPRGYYVDPDSIYNGVNPFTGREYQKYTLISLEADPPETMTQDQWKGWITEKRKWLSWKEAKLNQCNSKK